ncbi:MAG: hypothetical protein G01um101438_568 [Parcubacteria group bacterium Gr01-1014_38]|nr:MAG: hypothetical protein G01um101438_568 [Parcubacteria group bacterium Gr01-1014_38]
MTPEPSFPWPRISVAVIVAVAVLLGVVALRLSLVQTVLKTTAPHTDTDIERFGGLKTVGQSFVSPSDGLAEISFRLRSPLPVRWFPLFFHLRHGRFATRDLRTVVLLRTDVEPDGVVTTRFAPLTKSRGKPYAFVLDAPYAPSGTFAASRQIDGSLYGDGTLFRGTAVRQGDLEFSLGTQSALGRVLWTRFLAWAAEVRRVPGLMVALLLGSTVTLLLTMATVFGGIVTLLALWAPWWTQRLHRTRAWLLPVALGTLAVLHIALHLPFALSYPISNDEGAYLMDIQNLRVGAWPFLHTLAKGPLFLTLFAPVAFSFPEALLPARLFIAVTSALIIVPLYLLGVRHSDRTAGLFAAALWAFSPAVIGQTTHVLLQPLAVLLVALALLTISRQRDDTPWRTRWAYGGGALLAAAYLTRVSSVAFLPSALLLPFVMHPRRAAWRTAARTGLGFALTLLVAALLFLPILGAVRTAITFNVEAVLIGQARNAGGPDVAAFWPPRELLERISAYGSTLFRTGLPVVILWWAFLLSQVRTVLRLPGWTAALAFLGGALPLLLELQRNTYFFTDDSNAPFAALARIAAPAFVLLVAARLLTLRRESGDPATLRRAWRGLLLGGGSWLALTVVYAYFGRFRQHYHMEFLLPYILGAALFLREILVAESGQARARWRTFARRVLGPLVAGALAAATFLLYTPTKTQSHTGSIAVATAHRVADIIASVSGPREEILTAQGIFPFLAGRFLPFGASHPGWYLEERVGTVTPAMRRLFLPDKSVLRTYVRDKPIRLVAIDRRTWEVYFQFDADMRALVAEYFKLLAEVPNPSEEQPVEIWIRK